MTGAEARIHDAGMEATTKRQKAGRTFLLRLIAEYGPQGAARILRSLADEIEAPRRAGEVSRFAPPAMPR